MSQTEENDSVVNEKTTIEPALADASRNDRLAEQTNDSLDKVTDGSGDDFEKTMDEPLDSVKNSTDSTTSEKSKDGARYEVNVQHYAHYEETGDVYSQEMQKSLSYAARTPMGRFFSDFLFILTRPGAFWRAQDLHPVTIGQLHWPHLVILILLRMIAVFVGGILMPNAVFTTVLIQAVTQGFLIILLLWGFALIISGISALNGSGFQLDKGLRFSGYSITPIIFVGILSIIPVPYLATICDLLSMPWAFVILGAGVLPYLKIKPEHAPVITGLFCGILVILWSILPLLIPYLIGLAS